MSIRLKNESTHKLLLKGSTISGSSSTSALDLPQSIPAGATLTSVVPSSTSPYDSEWTYSPENGDPLMTFSCSLSGPDGININPSINGTNAANWKTWEGPSMEDGAWVITFTYAGASD